MKIQIIGMLTDCLPVSTSFKYLVNRDNIPGDIDFTDEQYEEDQHIQNILSMEVAIYLTRRTSGCCGTIIDNLRSIRNEFIKTYEDKWKRTFLDYNSDVDF